MNALLHTAADREQLFIALYKSAFPAVARYVHKMGGSVDEAKDIFQDALVIYYEKAVAGFEANSSPKAYLLGISKYLWLHRFKDYTLCTDLEGIDISDETEAAQHSGPKLMYYLETAGKRCMELLRSFYYDELPLGDIAQEFGFSGVRSATVQKYKCLEKVRETIKQKSLSYADFID